MQPADDSVLLRQYSEAHSEVAFAALVTRHVNLVYSAALRQAGNPHHAEEITQAVFVILAQKAGGLRQARALTSWLFQTTRLTAANFARSEARRHRHEQEAYMQSSLDKTVGEAWPAIAPLLDSAVAALSEPERQAILLRYYEDRNLREVGQALGASEDAAEKRVSRALEKLRKFLAKRGVSFTTTIIAGTMSAHSVQAAPAGLAGAVTALAVTKGAAAGASTLTLIKGALKIMAWTKAKTAVAIGLGVLLAVGTTTVTVQEIKAYRTYPWQTDRPTPDTLDQADPQVRILPAKYFVARRPGLNENVHGTIYKNDGGKMFGLQQSLQTVVQCAYCFGNGARFVFPTNLLPELKYQDYDFMASLPQGNEAALQGAVKQKFGVVATPETRETGAWLLEVKTPNAPGLKPARDGATRAVSRRGWHYTMLNLSLADFATNVIEPLTDLPVIDQTGLPGGFDLDLDFKGAPTPDTPANFRGQWKQALLDQLGLELVPTNLPVEMLVVEKAQ